MAGVFGVVRNCQVPYGAPDNRFDTYPTWWSSVTDLTNRVYYFQSTRSPNVVWLELDVLDLVRHYGVILDWGSGEVLPRTTAQYRELLERRSAGAWRN